MILLLANRWDESAKALARRWSGHGAVLLTADDLSRPGWVHRLPISRSKTNVYSDTLVAARCYIPERDLTAVLTLTPRLIEQELFTVTPADRTYVAAEINAFLLAWLSSLRSQCPVVNRPTATSLAGPYWRRERWIHAAAECEIPIRPVRRFSSFNPPPAPAGLSPEATEEIPTTAVILTVIGDHVLPESGKPESHPALHRHAIALARVAKVDLLAARFSSSDADACFLDADPFPNLSEDAHADAVLLLLQKPQPLRNVRGAGW
jgi:hypothetical protein